MLSTFSQLLLTIYRRAQEAPVQEFQDLILGDIQPFIPFDSSMWGTATMTDGGIDIHSMHLYRSSPQMLEAYEAVKHQDIAAARATSRARHTQGFNARALFSEPSHHDLRDFCVRFGHENAFITSDIHPVTRFVHWVSLYRADAARFCTEAEIQMLEHISLHMMQALAINRLVHFDRLMGDVARENWAVAIADRRCVLYHADTRFSDLVGSEWPGCSRDKLPAPLMASLNGKDSRLIGKKVVLERSLEHEVLFLKARKRQAVDSLSTRELIVGRLLVSGLTQKQVAAQLDRSPETIRTQVRVMFDKLDIGNVVMLAPHLAMRD